MAVLTSATRSGGKQVTPMRTVRSLIFGIALLLVLLILTSAIAAQETLVWRHSTYGSANSVAISSDGSYEVATLETGTRSGKVLFFNKAGSMLWEHDFDRIISSCAISSDGSYVVAGGYQLIGVAGVYSNGAVYFFDRSGALLWNLTTGSDPVFSVAITRNGSRIAVDLVSALLYLDKDGRLLWRYDSDGTIGPISMSADGQFLLLSISNIMDHNPVMLWKILYLNMQGKVIWNFTGTNAIIEDATISADGKYVVAGASVSGWDGTLYAFNSDGDVLWKIPISSAILPVAISPDDSLVVAGTNWGITAFDNSGMLVWNYTGATASALAISAVGSQVLAGLWQYSGPAILLFSRRGQITWSYPAGPIHQVAVSSDGTYGVIGAGTATLGPYSSTSASVYMVSLSGGGMREHAPSSLTTTIYIAVTVAVSVAAIMMARRYRQRHRNLYGKS